MKKLIPMAICYDFDGTLAFGNMQEHGFVNKLQMTPREFWQMSNDYAKEQNADPILAYMKLMRDCASLLLPISESCYALLHCLGGNYLVKLKRLKLAIVNVSLKGLDVSSSKRSKHSAEALVILYLFNKRRPNGLIVDDKYDSCVKSSFGKLLVKLVEKLNVPVGNYHLAALVALAMVVEKVCKPNVEIGNVLVRFGIIGNLFNKKSSCLGI